MKLLLAEDERELSNALCRILKINKYEVDAVYDGEAALEALENAVYDGMILDVMMPKKDGFAVAKEMRARGDNTPVLMLTAKAELDDKVEGLDAGADDYLTKPFAVKELLARIRAITRRTGEVSETQKFGNMSINPQNSELSALKTVRLTRKEYLILELLIRNKNTLLSSERIMDKVWEFESDADISVVWVFISSLRKKLEVVGADCIIKAVRGVGYKLERRE
ncbi:MAG: response regulator transcription factor [Clostridia bacterium]|nr:response regulator transcription factor [Clostridia bacterium]